MTKEKVYIYVYIYVKNYYIIYNKIAYSARTEHLSI